MFITHKSINFFIIKKEWLKIWKFRSYLVFRRNTARQGGGERLTSRGFKPPRV